MTSTKRTQTKFSADKVALQLLEALGSSLDIQVVLKEAYPLLTRLVPADYGALGVSSTARPQDFEWAVAELPMSFFAAYPDMAEHDFVRRAVVSRPNRVLRDQEMVSRGELERNMMYRRAREVGAPVEHVMAVMLHVDDHWQSGLSLYRERRRPFSSLERTRLQSVTPALANAVRNCRQFGQLANWKRTLDGMLANDSIATLLARSDGTEAARSPGTTAVLDRWFAAHERSPGGLPAPVVNLVLRAHDGLGRQLRRQIGQVTLDVSAFPVPGHFGNARWMLRFEVHSDEPTVPEEWCAQLTPREREVTLGVLRGWDNRLVSSELDCTEATVKKHLQRIFQKLGVESRTALVSRAARRLA